MTSKPSVKNYGNPANISFTRTPTGTSHRPRIQRTGWKMDGSKEVKIEDVDNESIPLTKKEALTEIKRKELSRRTSVNETEIQTNKSDINLLPHMPNAVTCDDEDTKGETSVNKTVISEVIKEDDNETKGLSNGDTSENKEDVKVSAKRHISLKTIVGVGITQLNEVPAIKTDVKCNGTTSNNTDAANGILMTKTGNGVPRKLSLSVPGLAPSDRKNAVGTTRKDSILSLERESSKMSIESRRSADIRFQYTAVQIPADDMVKTSLYVQDDSWIKIAIPYLPLGLAIFCLLLNIVVPGSGTMLSGVSIFCCAKSRVPPKFDQDLLMILCVNVWVGMAQLFTVSFLLVGWFWSLAWGIKMVILAVERRREMKIQRAKELKTLALSAFGSTIPGGLGSIT